MRQCIAQAFSYISSCVPHISQRHVTSADIHETIVFTRSFAKPLHRPIVRRKAKSELSYNSRQARAAWHLCNVAGASQIHEANDWRKARYSNQSAFGSRVSYWYCTLSRSKRHAFSQLDKPLHSCTHLWIDLDPRRFGRSKLLNAMHFLREPALLPVDAPETTHSALGRHRVRTTMAVYTHTLVTTDTVAAGRLA